MIYSEASENFHTRTINLRGVELDVEFRFYEAIPATANEPPSPEELIIEAVFVDDIEISNLLGDKTFAGIEQEILKLYDDKGIV